MERFYTENALIRYIYNESDFFEKFEIEYALKSDRDVRTMYFELKDAYLDLPKATFLPSQNVLNDILNFSRNNTIEAGV